MLTQGLEDWLLWAWVVVVAGGIVAAIATRLLRPTSLPHLPLRHVAAAALIGSIGWMALMSLPSTLLQFTSSVGQIATASDSPPYLPYTVAAIAMIAASAIAVLGILRRKPWGIVLGAGMAVAHVGTSVLGTIAWLSFMDQVSGDEGNLIVYAGTYVLGAVPALVAIALLLWPARGRALRSAGDREAADGIIDADSEAAREIDWPDWNAPAERRT